MRRPRPPRRHRRGVVTCSSPRRDRLRPCAYATTTRGRTRRGRGRAYRVAACIRPSQLADSSRRPTRGDLILVAVFLVWGLLEAFFVNHPGPVWARALAAVGFAIPLLWRRPAPVVALAAIGAVAALRAFTVRRRRTTARCPSRRSLSATSRSGSTCGGSGFRSPARRSRSRSSLALSRSPDWRGERHVGRLRDLDLLRLQRLDCRLPDPAPGRAGPGGRGGRRRACARGGREERARIARELHDVVAHSVSIIALQAGAAKGSSRPSRRPRASTWPPCAGRRTRRSSRCADSSNVLREDEPTYEPTPAVTDLDELVATARDAGLPSSSAARATSTGSLPASRSPSTASCRSRSRTCASTPAPHRRVCCPPRPRPG